MTTPLSHIPTFGPRTSTRRNGKIARLPKETRDQINRVLDNGFTYRAVINELGEAGAGLNLQNLSNWFHHGYQAWLLEQQLTERTKAYTQQAIDLLRETGAADASTLLEAGHVIGAVQLMEVLMDHGDGTLKKLLAEKPEAYIRIMNLVCRLANSGLRSEKRRDLAKPAEAPLKPN
jgi:hypothetical protein